MNENPKRILRVYVEMLLDEHTDLSHLGKYSDVPGPGAVDRAERGDMRSGEFRWFIPAMTAEQTPESVEQDYARMESFEHGDWRMVGIRASAEVVAAGTTQTISSSGLWDVESDSEPSYFTQVAEEELENLYDILAELGFTDARSTRVEYPEGVGPVKARTIFREPYE